MKALTKLALAAGILCFAFAAEAEWVNGYFRNNGMYVAPYCRTPANGIVYNDLSYRTHTPNFSSYSFPCNPTCGYSPRCSYYPSPYTFSGTSTTYGNTTYHNYHSSFGDSWSGTTTRYGNTAYTTLNGW